MLGIAIGVIPILCGAIAYSVLMAAPSSDMSLWMLRKTAIKGICICCLVQGLLVMWFLAMRSWRRCLLALVCRLTDVPGGRKEWQRKRKQHDELWEKFK